MRAIGLLAGFKIRNSLRTLFKDPRKYIPLVLILILIVFPIVMSLWAFNQTPPNTSGISINPRLFENAIFLALLLLVIGTIDTGLGDNLLAFGMSDVDYVFPSPISRRIVLAYRLPALTFGAFFSSLFIIYILRLGVTIAGPKLPHLGTASDPGWWIVAAVALCVGIYLNGAMFIAIQFRDRKMIHRTLMILLIGFIAVLGLVGWLKGMDAVFAILESKVLRALFLPAQLASNTVIFQATRQPSSHLVFDLFFIYAVSFVPMFATNTNFYEQSIASSERISSFRLAAKGGMASMMAAKASAYKSKSTREYTIRPFGVGPIALLWAHFCASLKRPYLNFGAPIVGGAAVGVLGALVDREQPMMGLAVVAGMTIYLSFSFMGSAKTASEAAVRRRELIAPLPLKGWETVYANLAVPFFGVFLFGLALSIAYAALKGTFLTYLLAGVLLIFPIRLASRMVIQYFIVLGYPDFSDKIQQLFASFVYYVFGAPLFIGELIVCIPAILLKSVWAGIGILAVYELFVLGLSLALAGLASEKSIASGEPIRIFQFVVRRT